MVLRVQTFLIFTLFPFFIFAQCTSKLTTQAQPTVVLDFDGDGLSEVVTAISLPKQTGFTIFYSSDQTLNSDSLGIGKPALGDYDGDGHWDFGVVRQSEERLEWEVKLSASGKIIKQKFGKDPEQILTGCRFLSSNKTSLAYIKNRRLYATEVGGEGAKKVGFADVSSGALLGCGDADGDGIDEPIFKTALTGLTVNALATAGCKGELLLYKNIKPFASLGIVQRSTDDFPLVIAARSAPRSQSVITLEALSEGFGYPRFNVASTTKFSSGIFKLSDTETSYGVVWQEKRDQAIRRRLFSKNPRTPDLVSAATPGTLVAPQRLYSLAELE